MHTLVVEDEADLREQLRAYLHGKGYVVDVAADGEEGLYYGEQYPVDLAVIDIGLPKLSGIELIRRLRSEGKRFPILILTARDNWQDKVEGLESGADDYLVKPFELQEVEVRLEVLTTRGIRRASKDIQIGDLSYNVDTLIVSRNGQEIDLNPIGLKLLRCLMEASPNVVTRTELEKEVWGEEMPDSDSLRVHIHSLRSAIDKPFGSKMIQTRHGIGYRLVESNAVQT